MSFGDHLREARERHGMTLREISERTNIAVRMLDALERDEIEKLPGGIFSRAFVRSYAVQVGLDADETVERFLAEFSEPAAGVATSPAAGSPDDHAQAVAAQAGAVDRQRASLRVAGALVGGLCLFVLLAYGAVQLVRGPDLVEPRGREPRSAPASHEPPVEQAAELPPPPASAPASAPASGPVPITTPDGVTVQRVRNANAVDHLTIDIHPQAPCWVRLVIDGRLDFARLLEPGARVVRRAEDRIVVQVGDAAAFQYTLNDAPGKSLGASGEVVTARIDKSNLEEFIARQ